MKRVTIVCKPHEHRKTMAKTPVKFQNNQHKTVDKVPGRNHGRPNIMSPRFSSKRRGKKRYYSFALIRILTVILIFRRSAVYLVSLLVNLVSKLGELRGSVVECLTRNRGTAGSSLTGVTALCP